MHTTWNIRQETETICQCVPLYVEYLPIEARFHFFGWTFSLLCMRWLWLQHVWPLSESPETVRVHSSTYQSVSKISVRRIISIIIVHVWTNAAVPIAIPIDNIRVASHSDRCEFSSVNFARFRNQEVQNQNRRCKYVIKILLFAFVRSVKFCGSGCSRWQRRPTIGTNGKRQT